MAKQEAYVNPKALAWTRAQAGSWSVEEVAVKVGVKGEVVEAWEGGQKRPTFKQLTSPQPLSCVALSVA